MKQELLDQALASLDAIIRDEIEGADPQKYTRIIAIAVQAHRMRKRIRRRERVADNLVGAQGLGLGMGMYVGGQGHDAELHAAMQGEIVEDMEGGDGLHVQPPLHGLGRHLHPPDAGDLMEVLRETLSTIRPVEDPFDRVAKRVRALSETRAALHDAHGDTSTIDAQIRDLTATLTDLKENSDAAEPHPALVYSELLRGRPPRGRGEEPMPRDRGEDDRARARGPQDAGRGGIEATVVADVEGSPVQ